MNVVDVVRHGELEGVAVAAPPGDRTGVAPFVTTCFGPRTAAAGFAGSTWSVHSIGRL